MDTPTISVIFFLISQACMIFSMISLLSQSRRTSRDNRGYLDELIKAQECWLESEKEFREAERRFMKVQDGWYKHMEVDIQAINKRLDELKAYEASLSTTEAKIKCDQDGNAAKN